MTDFWKPSIAIEFSIDARLEDCLERLETYDDWWRTEPSGKQISTVKDGEIYDVWLRDKMGFVSLDIQLQKSGEVSLISGTASYSIAALLVIIIFSVFIMASAFAVYQPDLMVLSCPTIFWGWVWFTMIVSRYSFLRRVKKILGRATKPKRG